MEHSTAPNFHCGNSLHTWMYGNCEEFDVKVDVHHGSVLSPLLFVIVLEALTSGKGKVFLGNCCILMT